MPSLFRARFVAWLRLSAGIAPKRRRPSPDETG